MTYVSISVNQNKVGAAFCPASVLTGQRPPYWSGKLPTTSARLSFQP